MRQRLGPRPHTTLTLVQRTRDRPVALPDRMLIDHPITTREHILQQAAQPYERIQQSPDR